MWVPHHSRTSKSHWASCWPQKDCKMVWCVAKARRNIKQRMRRGQGLKATISTCIFQDGHGGKLHVRIRAASSTGACFSGFLPDVDLAHQFSLDALGVQRATMHAIQRSCTPHSSLPYLTVLHLASELDEDLQEQAKH